MLGMYFLDTKLSVDSPDSARLRGRVAHPVLFVHPLGPVGSADHWMTTADGDETS